MFTKRRVRFSIGAMLVVTAVVAVLLNHEVLRARAIETTVKQIDDWDGSITYRRRANMPSFLVNLLPESWSVEIDSIFLLLDSKEEKAISSEDEYGVVGFRELDHLMELGALDQMTGVIVDGTAFNHAVISRLCRSSSMHSCVMIGVSLSDDEIEDLKRAFPHCNFDVIK